MGMWMGKSAWWKPGVDPLALLDHGDQTGRVGHPLGLLDITP